MNRNTNLSRSSVPFYKLPGLAYKPYHNIMPPDKEIRGVRGQPHLLVFFFQNGKVRFGVILPELGKFLFDPSFQFV